MLNRFLGSLSTDIYTISAEEIKVAHLRFSEEQTLKGLADSVCAATEADTEADTIITEDITNPPYPRNLVVAVTGIPERIKKSDVAITGTNILDEIITEKFAFAGGKVETIYGNCAFKTVTKIVIPAQTGDLVNFTVGYSDKLGLPYRLTGIKPSFALKAGALTTSTLTTDADAIEENTIKLNGTLDSNIVDIYLCL